MKLTHRIRYIVLGLLRKSWSVRRFTHIPRGVIATDALAKTYCQDAASDAAGAERALPICIDPTRHWKFLAQTERPCSSRFVLAGKDWFAWGNQGCVLTADAFVVADVSREFGRDVHSIFLQASLIRPEKINGPVAVLAAPGAEVYYHWMFDILPRIALLRESGCLNDNTRFILNYSKLPFQQESLARLKVDRDALLVPRNHWDFHLQAECLLVPSFLGPPDTVSKRSVDFLRATFLDPDEVRQTPRSKIFIKRVSGRRILNESEVEEFLKARGFIIVQLESYNIRQQAAIFARATQVVGPHGAGFTNLAYCAPKTRVVDIFSPNWVNTCYWTLACECELEYAYLLGEGDVPRVGDDPGGKGDNIMIDLKKLKQLVD